MDEDEVIDWQSGELQVVVNEDRYCSIWPLHRDVPLGWRSIGVEGKKDVCLRYIEENCDGVGRLLAVR